MTQQEKQLLLSDLCSRLPHGVKVKYFDMEYPFGSEPVILTPYLLYNRWENIHDVKPYLRSMSLMTEEEKNEAIQFEIINLGPIGFNWNLLVSNSSKLVNWLNKHHLDFRGLIDKGLALEAPADMYKMEG